MRLVCFHQSVGFDDDSKWFECGGRGLRLQKERENNNNNIHMFIQW